MDMAEARDRCEWNRTAHLAAILLNVNRGKGKPPIKAETQTPYGSENRKGVRLQRDNIQILKQLIPNSARK